MPRRCGQLLISQLPEENAYIEQITHEHNQGIDPYPHHKGYKGADGAIEFVVIEKVIDQKEKYRCGDNRYKCGKYGAGGYKPELMLERRAIGVDN